MAYSAKRASSCIPDSSAKPIQRLQIPDTHFLGSCDLERCVKALVTLRIVNALPSMLNGPYRQKQPVFHQPIVRPAGTSSSTSASLMMCAVFAEKDGIVLSLSSARAVHRSYDPVRAAARTFSAPGDFFKPGSEYFRMVLVSRSLVCQLQPGHCAAQNKSHARRCRIQSQAPELRSAQYVRS